MPSYLLSVEDHELTVRTDRRIAREPSAVVIRLAKVADGNQLGSIEITVVEEDLPTARRRGATVEVVVRGPKGDEAAVVAHRDPRRLGGIPPAGNVAAGQRGDEIGKGNAPLLHSRS